MKIISIFISLLFLFQLMTSCNTTRQRADSYAGEYQKNTKMEDGISTQFGEQNQVRLIAFIDKNKGSEMDTEITEKKVIFNGNITLTVKQPDSTNAHLEAIAKKYKGYVTELGFTSSTIRVQANFMKIAMEEIEGLGRVERKYISGKDVTDEYLDVQIRLENAEKARTRYLALLEKAENVEAALLVEKELERLNGAIDMLKGKMNRIEHLAEYSTITVYLKEKKKPGVLGYIGIGLYRSVKWLFVRN